MSEITELAAETLHLQRTARVAGDPRILIIDDDGTRFANRSTPC